MTLAKRYDPQQAEVFRMAHDFYGEGICQDDGRFVLVGTRCEWGQVL